MRNLSHVLFLASPAQARLRLDCWSLGAVRNVEAASGWCIGCVNGQKSPPLSYVNTGSKKPYVLPRMDSLHIAVKLDIRSFGLCHRFLQSNHSLLPRAQITNGVRIKQLKDGADALASAEHVTAPNSKHWWNTFCQSTRRAYLSLHPASTLTKSNYVTSHFLAPIITSFHSPVFESELGALEASSFALPGSHFLHPGPHPTIPNHSPHLGSNSHAHTLPMALLTPPNG